MLAPRPVEDSRVEMTQIVLPGDTNAHGTAFGGQVMAWMDICGAIAAQRHCRRAVVTAAVDELEFVEPIKKGMVVVLRAQVNMTWRSSMEVGVRVESENPTTGERRHALTAYLTFVAKGEDDRPVAVPPVVATAPADVQRQGDAVARRQARLDLRAARARRGEPVQG
ncbi:MAG: acyl-CoA thioesterase [Deltaproteobacteria bacterium]|nr:acyl-CoA thioesterase [Deltaproteobacteria bacterium]